MSKNAQSNHCVNITITIHGESLAAFFGKKKWPHAPKHATFKNPMDVVQFCTINWTGKENDQSCCPAFVDNTTIEWTIVPQFSANFTNIVDLYTVFQLMGRLPERDTHCTHDNDWKDLLDFDSPNGVPNTDGQISYDGKLHVKPLNRQFKMKLKSKISSAYNLSYTILFAVPIQQDDKETHYMYCKIDPVIRNNTDQGIPGCK